MAKDGLTFMTQTAAVFAIVSFVAAFLAMCIYASLFHELQKEIKSTIPSSVPISIYALDYSFALLILGWLFCCVPAAFIGYKAWSRDGGSPGSCGCCCYNAGAGEKQPRANNSASAPVNAATTSTPAIASPPVSASPTLPHNWEQKTAPDGRTYYVNHNDKTTHWTLPKN